MKSAVSTRSPSTGEDRAFLVRPQSEISSAASRVGHSSLFDTSASQAGETALVNALKPYLEYKESGQAWIGAIPQHWTLFPNRAIFAEVKDRDHPDEEMLSVTITQGIVRQKALLAASSKKDSSNQDKSAYKLVQPRDLAYNKMRAWQGAIGVSDLRGIISPAYVVMRLREANDPRYFHYLFRTQGFAKEAERWSYGITSDMWSLRPEHFKMIYSPFPPGRRASEHRAVPRPREPANRPIHPREEEGDRAAERAEAGNHPARRDPGPRP